MTVESPLEIVLEFARAESTGDAHAFRFAPQSYIVRTPRGGFGASELAWSDELLGKLAAVRVAGQDPALLADIGAIMRRFLAPAGWELHEQLLTAAMQQRRPVQVTIRSAAAELYALPWELLTLRATGQSLGGLPGVLVRYEWPETATAGRSDPPAGGGRVLVAWSAAGGGVPAREHIAAIQAAAAAGEFVFAADDILDRASPGRIAAALSAGERTGRPIAALHLLCHGGARGSFFGLVLDGEGVDDEPVLLDPARLQQILAPHAATLRLVVLAACDGGNAGKFGGLLGSAAQMLHRAGVAAVVASRYPLSTAGSERLTEALYRGLLGGRASLEEAFVAARTVLASDAARLDWASVQLYARASDGAATYPILPARASAPAPEPTPSTVPAPAPAPAPARGAAAIVAAIAVATVAAVAAWAGGLFGGPTPAPIEGATAVIPAESEPVSKDISSTASDPKVDATTNAAPPDPPATTSTTGAASTSASTPEDPPSTSGEPPSPTPTKKTTKKSPPAAARASVECTSGVKSYVRALLPGGGGPVVRLVIKADADGRLTATGGDAAAAAAARDRLKAGNADKVKKAAGAALPCHYSHEWSRGG